MGSKVKYDGEFLTVQGGLDPNKNRFKPSRQPLMKNLRPFSETPDKSADLKCPQIFNHSEGGEMRADKPFFLAPANRLRKKNYEKARFLLWHIADFPGPN